MKNNSACQGNIVSNMTQYDINEKERLLSLLTQDSTVYPWGVYLFALHNGQFVQKNSIRFAPGIVRSSIFSALRF
ncbi:MAG: hypothetical protein CVU62_02780 [Deltaproteobacteria bacterium HGW-Deltaproteobacteria-2]|jgi:hypothetical protein|nr:MAG: hypothetical protein CVU62_02780 [Deltaproteobacteria bacterium HGW-Deltaproteobacteria-2]